jgi:anti-anti-sigma factor
VNVDGSTTNGQTSCATVVALDGEFDLADRQRVADAFQVALKGGAVIVDLSSTAYIDSTVLSELVKLRNGNGVRPSEHIFLTQPNGSVLRLFDVSQMAELFAMRPSVEEALAELGLSESVQRITLVGKD